MTEEFIDERERDLVDYYRNNLTDPESRITTVAETHTATTSQTAFILRNNFVKNVADTITVDSVTKRKGYDYTVSYGEGKNTTTLTLNTGASVDDAVVINYDYGPSMIEREFSRSDVKLPRIVISFLTGSEEFAALGDNMESTKGSYFNVSYNIEIRDKFASRARRKAAEAFNLAKKMRQANLYRTNIVTARDLQNFDYDYEKNAYIWIFTISIQWEIMFE